MPVSQEFRNHVAELLKPIGAIGVRGMFGGAGIYSGDTMFALIADDTLYFKTDDGNRAAFSAEGCGPFTFKSGSGRKVSTSYWLVPPKLMDEPDALVAWAREALAAARRGRQGRPIAARPIAPRSLTRCWDTAAWRA